MKRVAIGLVFLTLLVQEVSAEDRRGWFYLFAGAGRGSGDGSPSVVQGGAGGEFLLKSGFGLGGEFNHTTSARRTGGFSAAAVNASYHFGGREAGRKLVPFVTGGGFFMLGGRDAGADIGGGIQYWWTDRMALRVEFRTHILSSDVPYIHMVRFGIALR